MSELRDAIDEMRNMRESYDQLAGAAEAYNEGKPALASAITAKGQPTAASDSLATMAENVSRISQDTYEIDGGEMYAKQLFGVTSNDTVPGYWNLYEILEQLLSDGRLVNYGGILLAEYYKGYDSLALAGAGAGGAYVVSDVDNNGNFIMYTEDTTHTWKIEDDGKGNRWVAYLFADSYHSFDIANTNTSPRSIYIGRKVGTINCLVDTRVSKIVVPDGNEFMGFVSNNHTSKWDKSIVIRNITQTQGTLIYSPDVDSVYVSGNELRDSNLIFSGAGAVSVIANFETISNSSILGQVNGWGNYANVTFISIKANYIPSVRMMGIYSTRSQLRVVRIQTEDAAQIIFDTQTKVIYDTTIYLDYITNDKSKSVNFSAGRLDDSAFYYIPKVVLQDGWNKPVNISPCSRLDEEVIYTYILQRLKQDEVDCGVGVTITLGADNLARLTSAESISLLDSLTNTYGYTFA